MSEKLEQFVIRANELFGILKEPYEHKQHCNEQRGLDLYVELVNFETGEICHKKLYRNTKGLHFKHSSRYGSGGSFYIEEMTTKVLYVPFQTIKNCEEINLADENEKLRKKLHFYVSTEPAVSAEGQRLLNKNREILSLLDVASQVVSGVIKVADRKTPEFDAAKQFLISYEKARNS